MNVKHAIFIFCTALTAFLGRAQSQTFIQALNEAQSSEDPQQTIQKLQEVGSLLAEQSDSIKGIYYYQLGVGYGMTYELETADSLFQLALTYAGAAGDTLTQMGTYNGLGNVSRMSNQNDRAKEYFESGLNLAGSVEREGFYKWRSDLLGNLAGIYFDLKDYETSLKYSQDALGNSEEIQDSANIALNLIRMAYSYNALKETEEAYKANLRATSILEAIGNRPMLIYQYYSLGNELLNRQELSQARDYFNRCLQLSEEFDERETYAGSLSALGRIAFETGDLVIAQSYADRALKVALEENLLTHQERAYQLLYDLAINHKESTDALSYLQKYYAVKDSIQRRETLASIEEFKIKYETAEKEREIFATRKELESKERFQLFLVIIIGVIVLFSIVSILLIIQRHRLKQKLLSQEMDNLRMQINKVFTGGVEQLDLDRDHINQKLYRPLSEREFDVLKAAISDKTNSEIADSVYLSVNTVKYHLRNIYEKLGVSNRKEALEKILSKG